MAELGDPTPTNQLEQQGASSRFRTCCGAWGSRVCLPGFQRASSPLGASVLPIMKKGVIRTLPQGFRWVEPPAGGAGAWVGEVASLLSWETGAAGGWGSPSDPNTHSLALQHTPLLSH